ncbi:MAG: light-harvesting protein [Paracoccaceae bacterium]|nr:light-harvesting protein [Paracoccaceae bacterium]
MNNAKMWLVVKPTVGVPLFLTGVAVGSFAVHVAVLTNTSWVNDFLQGKELGSGDMAAAAVLEPDDNVAKANYVVPQADGAKEVTVVLPDGTTARAILQPDVLAAN